MTEASNSRALRDAIVGDPVQHRPQIGLRTAIVTAVDKSGTAAGSWTATVRFADGSTASGIGFYGWWNASVNAVVDVLTVGPTLRILGPMAPSAVYAGTPPAWPAPPAPPAGPPTVRTVTVQPADAAMWDAQAQQWRTDVLAQGGVVPNRAMWFYGAAVATAIGAGSLVSASLYVQRLMTANGPDGPANVRTGTHAFTARPGDGSGPLGNVAAAGTLARGQARMLVLPATVVAALGAGAAGVGLEPGVLGSSNADTLAVAALGDNPASGQLTLTISG